MATTGSVSKACFVFKPQAKKAKKLNKDGYFSQDNHQQLNIYQKLWQNVSADIEALGSQLSSKIFNDLLTFVNGAHQKAFKAKTKCLSVGNDEIPTAALITGVNTPDHNVMFANLVTLMNNKVSPYVAMLKSKDCPTLKQLMIKILTQIIGSQVNLDDSETIPEKSSSVKIRNCTMDVLVAWYSSQTTKPNSPRKKPKTDVNLTKPPVVILFEDLEAFPAHVLQDFILVCSNHLTHLPIVLIFGIATTVTAVHCILSHQVSSLLCMEKFQAPPSTEYLSKVLDQVVMTAEYPFKVGCRVFRLLLDMFLYHDFSVINFIHRYQFSMMQHFYNNPLSILCCPLEDLKCCISGLNHRQLEQLRRTISFRSYVESRSWKEQILLLTDDKFFQEALFVLMGDLHKYHENFFTVLTVLNTLTRALPRHPLGKQVRETYSMCLESNIYETDKYKEAMDLLSTLSRDDLVSLLNQCIEKMSATGSISKELDQELAAFNELLQKLTHIEDLSLTYECNSGEQEVSALPKKTDMHTLRKTLLDKKKKKLTVYELLRKESCSYFDQLFRKYLRAPYSLPMYETLYYDVASELRLHRNAAPRAAIQVALSNPYLYLKYDNLRLDNEGISSALPDISVVYKLHLECGRLINLYDWLQAFITVVTSDQPDDIIDRELKQPRQALQARFIRAVSELQFLGFIKPTKRKTDHVSRLTWGGC